MKIEVLFSDQTSIFEKVVNDFIKNKEIFDIKYSNAWDYDFEKMMFSAMVIYKT